VEGTHFVAAMRGSHVFKGAYFALACNVAEYRDPGIFRPRFNAVRQGVLHITGNALTKGSEKLPSVDTMRLHWAEDSNHGAHGAHGEIYGSFSPCAPCAPW
jgi:hypothetical protein